MRSKRARASCPSQRALHGAARGAGVDGMFQAFVEHHGDIGAEPGLDVGGFFRSEEVSGPVEM